MRVLGLYSWASFWSMGPRTGANSFFLAPLGFVRLGHEVHISMPYARGLARSETDEGVHLHRYRGAIRFDSNAQRPLPIRLTSRILRYVYYILIGTWNGIRLGRQVRPDLVIGYGVHSAAAAFFVSRALGVPNVTRLFGFQFGLYKKSPFKLPGAFMEFIALKLPARYVVMHDDGSLGDEAARRLKIPPERVRFWRDGLDSSLYRPGEDTRCLRRTLGIPEDHTILFCVGRLGDDKKMGRLVEVLPTILGEESRVSLMLVGDGPDRPKIEAAVREAGLEEHVRLAGAVSRGELPPYLNLGDIFVGVSDRTNANLAPVEAMSCAKPVVALDAGGTRTLVEDGITGSLIDPCRWRTELPRVLLELLRDPERRARLGQAGRERVLRLLPSIEERQRMEVDLAVQAVREYQEEKARRRRG